MQYICLRTPNSRSGKFEKVIEQIGMAARKKGVFNTFRSNRARGIKYILQKLGENSAISKTQIKRLVKHKFAERGSRHYVSINSDKILLAIIEIINTDLDISITGDLFMPKCIIAEQLIDVLPSKLFACVNQNPRAEKLLPKIEYVYTRQFQSSK